MKDKRGGGDDWFRPWVVRPDLLRVSQQQQPRVPHKPRTGLVRHNRLLKGRSSSSTRLNDIATKLEAPEAATPPLNRMSAGYSLANLSQLGDDVEVYNDRFHSLCFDPSSPLNQSFDDAIDNNNEDDISLYSLPASTAGDPFSTNSFLMTKQRIGQKTLSLPYKHFDSDGERISLTSSLIRDYHSSILTNKTPNKCGAVRRCPSPHAKLANGVFLPQDLREGPVSSPSSSRSYHSKRRTAAASQSE